MSKSQDRPYHIRVPSAVLSRKRLSSSAKLAWGFIRYRQGRNPTGWPGLRDIASHCGFDLKTATRSVEQLEQQGLVTVERRGERKVNRYVVVESVGKTPAVGEGPCTQNVPSTVGETGTRLYPKRVRNHNKQNKESEHSSRRKNPDRKIEATEPMLIPDAAQPESTPRAKHSREPNPIWDTLVDLFHITSPTKSERSRLGRAVQDLKEKNATTEEIRSVYKRCQTEWDGKAFQIEALIKWFDLYRTGATSGSSARVRNGGGRYSRVAKRVDASLPQ